MSRLKQDLMAVALLSNIFKWLGSFPVVLSFFVLGGGFIWFLHYTGPIEMDAGEQRQRDEGGSRSDYIPPGQVVNPNFSAKQPFAFLKLTGPLAKYRVQATSEDLAPCRSADCTITSTPLLFAENRLFCGVSYQPPKRNYITIPDGYVLPVFKFDWVVLDSRQPAASNNVDQWASGRNRQGYPQGTLSRLVSSPGYFRSVTIAGTTQDIQLNGVVTNDALGKYSGVEGNKRLQAENRVLAAVEFQPVNPIFKFYLPSPTGLPVKVKISAVLHFEEPPSPSLKNSCSWNTSGASKALSPGVPVSSVTKLKSGGLGNSVINLSIDGNFNQVLRERVTLEQTQGIKAFPEHMWIEFEPLDTEADADLPQLKVPTSAIAYFNNKPVVWLLVDELVIPVQIKLVESENEITVIAEDHRGGALGLPIALDVWRGLTPFVRGRIYRSAHRLDVSYANKLLRLSTEVVQKPSATLKPGMKIRRINAAS